MDGCDKVSKIDQSKKREQKKLNMPLPLFSFVNGDSETRTHEQNNKITRTKKNRKEKWENRITQEHRAKKHAMLGDDWKPSRWVNYI
jgi:hypothetical protein